MEEPLTEDLLGELLASDDPVAFAERNAVSHRSLSAYLRQLLEEKGMARSQVIRDAGLNETFGYQIFLGQRNPSRNKVLQIAFAMGLSLREANRALRAAGVSELYCKDRRDAIVIFCLSRGCTLQEVQEELYRFGEDTIC